MSPKLLNHPTAMSLLRPLPDGVCGDGKTDPFSYVGCCGASESTKPRKLPKKASTVTSLSADLFGFRLSSCPLPTNLSGQEPLWERTNCMVCRGNWRWSFWFGTNSVTASGELQTAPATRPTAAESPNRARIEIIPITSARPVANLARHRKHKSHK